MDLYATELMALKLTTWPAIMSDVCAILYRARGSSQSRLSLPAVTGHFQPLVAKHDQVASCGGEDGVKRQASGPLSFTSPTNRGWRSEGFARSTNH